MLYEDWAVPWHRSRDLTLGATCLYMTIASPHHCEGLPFAERLPPVIHNQAVTVADSHQGCAPSNLVTILLCPPLQGSTSH